MKNVLKWMGIVVGALVLIVVLYGGYVFMQAGSIMSKTYPDVKGKNVYVTSDSATVARGEHLVKSIATCVGCHGKDLGGEEMDMMPFAYFSVPNITQGKADSRRAIQFKTLT
ncbi:MAG: hypothetical protein IPP40_10480 [bacterium]|nr:hypothetical protein [bacterium]